MMNIKQLQQTISQGESDNLEFKKSTSQLNGAIETLCAFLNGQGGAVIMGVSDKGKMVEQQGKGRNTLWRIKQ